MNCVFDAMTEALQRGGGVEIRDFGEAHWPVPYKSYSGPATPGSGEPVDVLLPSTPLPFFKAGGRSWKEIVNGGRHLPITGGGDGW